ncbi:hypothetical protein MRX96_016447 [Rhipicephalus microplus]
MLRGACLTDRITCRNRRARPSEAKALASKMVVLMIREDLYVIVVSLVVSNYGGICIFTYYFTDVSMLKGNGEETSQYTTAFRGYVKVAE